MYHYTLYPSVNCRPVMDSAEAKDASLAAEESIDMKLEDSSSDQTDAGVLEQPKSILKIPTEEVLGEEDDQESVESEGKKKE